LYHRLNVATLQTPEAKASALRIFGYKLFEHFADQLAQRHGRDQPSAD
jgi:transcriptional regulator of aromatic amino acid metabolism